MAIGNRSCEDNSAHIRTPPSREASGAAGVSPPWLGERTCNGTSAITRETAYCVLTNAGAITAAKPRGAYAPRSCSRAFAHRRNCDFCDAQSHIEKERWASARRESGTALAGECDSRRWTNHVKSGGCQPAVVRETRLQRRYRTRSRTLVACESRSGGREPAVGRETHLQERFRKVAGDCRRWPTNVGAITFVKPRGAYAPALARARLPAGGIATFPMYKCTYTRAAGVSPPWGVAALARAIPQFSGRLSPVCRRAPLHVPADASVVR